MITRRALGTRLQRIGLTGGGALALALNACAPGSGPGGAADGAAGPAGNPARPVTVTAWHAWDGPREPLMKTILERLKAQYPNITVEQSIVQLWQQANVEKLGAAVAAGSAPDVIMLYDIYVLQFGPEAKALQALDPWVRRDKLSLKEVFYDTDVEALQADGKTWLLPHTLPTTGVNVAFNKEMTERAGLDLDKNPPQSWDELVQAATRLTVRDGSGLSQLGADLSPSPGMFDVYLGTVKSATFSPDGKKVTFNEPKAIETMEWLVNARQAFGGRAAVSAVQQAAQGKDLFTEVRKLALGHANYALYFSWPQTVPDLKWGTFPVMPQQRGAAMALPHRLAWGWGTMSSARDKDAAWLLVKKMTADEDGGGYLQVTQGRPSPIRKINESGEFKAQNPYWPTVVKTVEQRWKRPASFIPPDATKALSDAITRISDEQVAPRAGLTEAAPQVQAILDQYWAGRGR